MAKLLERGLTDQLPDAARSMMRELSEQHGGRVHDRVLRLAVLGGIEVMPGGEALGVIAGMGIPTVSIGPVAVAASVFLLNAIASIGIETMCEGCAEEEENRKNALKVAATGMNQQP